MSDPFRRDPARIRQEYAQATARLKQATANRDNALAAAEKADYEILTYTRHVELCHKLINGLLDEWNWSKERETVAG